MSKSRVVTPGMRQVIVNGELMGEIPELHDDRKNAEAARAFLKSIGRKLPEITQEQSMFRQARSFMRAADEIHARDMRGDQKNELGFVPCIVNCSFAIELYLKTLAFVNDGAELRGHRLYDDLWLCLSDPAKAIVEEECHRVCETRKLKRRTVVSEALQQMNSAFVEWRYAFEERFIKGFPLQDASVVGAALDAVCGRAVQQAAAGVATGRNCAKDSID